MSESLSYVIHLSEFRKLRTFNLMLGRYLHTSNNNRQGLMGFTVKKGKF